MSNFSGHSPFWKTASNKGPSRSEAAVAPLSNNNLKAAQQRFCCGSWRSDVTGCQKTISKLFITDEEVSRLLAKADQAANMAVAIQGSVHPDNDRIHLR